jgi:hypothetical protein
LHSFSFCPREIHLPLFYHCRGKKEQGVTPPPKKKHSPNFSDLKKKKKERKKTQILMTLCFASLH